MVLNMPQSWRIRRCTKYWSSQPYNDPRNLDKRRSLIKVYTSGYDNT